jgi:hypothetical protein
VPFYRLGGAPQRLSRWEDEVFVDQAGMSTAWLPCVANSVAKVDVCKAYLNAPIPPSTTNTIRKVREWSTARYILEGKRGAQLDNEAWPLAEWDDQQAGQMIVVISPLWVRLRLIAYVKPFLNDGGPNSISVGVAMRLFCERATNTMLKVQA